MFLVSWPGGSWEASVRMTVTVLALYMAIVWVALIFWVYRDIRQRTRDPIVQTVAILLVLFFFLPGHWIYLILRPRYTLNELYERSLEEEAILQDLEDQKACPTCRRRVHDEFLMCPSCRTGLKEPCRHCSKPLSYAWLVCPYCGTDKPPRPKATPKLAAEKATVRAPRAPAPPSRAPAQPVTAPAAPPQAAPLKQAEEGAHVIGDSPS
jgi:RNA polymerase subunit RPABC4/transcription elongation factor Spt4